MEGVNMLDMMPRMMLTMMPKMFDEVKNILAEQGKDLGNHGGRGNPGDG
jgi:hypothetical protein